MGSRGPVSRGVIYARQLSQQGLVALHDGRIADAEKRFSEAIDHCPANTTARYQLANCLWKRGAHHEAITRLTEAIEMSNSPDADMTIELAYMQANVGRLNEAMRLAERAIRLMPDDPAAWQLHGDVLNASGEWRPALASLHRALALDPDNVHVQLATAEIYAQLELSLIHI